MKKLLGLAACLIMSFSLQAREVAGVQLPESVAVDGQTLQLNGAGIRSKFFMDLYVASLYTNTATQNDAAVINTEKPVAIQLDITSKLITSEKMAEAVNEGFALATDNHLEPLQKRLDQFIAVFQEEIKKGDQFLLVKIPGKGVDALKNGNRLTTVTGDDFSEALFAIWLGDKPADKKLKAAMLGQ